MWAGAVRATRSTLPTNLGQLQCCQTCAVLSSLISDTLSVVTVDDFSFFPRNLATEGSRVAVFAISLICCTYKKMGKTFENRQIFAKFWRKRVGE